MDVLFEDKDILVINKPAGLQSTTPRFGGPSVIRKARQRSSAAHLVHRLDRDTSGLMVVGLTPAALSHLNRQFRERQVKKIYQALVEQGDSPLPSRIDLPLAPHRLQRPRQVLAFGRGKPSQTRLVAVEQVDVSQEIRFISAGRALRSAGHDRTDHRNEASNSSTSCYGRSSYIGLRPLCPRVCRASGRPPNASCTAAGI